jgi:hypothetical protein
LLNSVISLERGHFAIFGSRQLELNRASRPEKDDLYAANHKAKNGPEPFDCLKLAFGDLIHDRLEPI